MKKLFTIFIILIIIPSLVFNKEKKEALEDFRPVPNNKINLNKIGDNLKEELKNLENEETIQIIIVFKKEIYPSKMLSDAKNMSKKERRKYVISKLKAESSTTQEKTIKYLRDLGNVSEIKSYWITSSIKCSTTKNSIMQLTKIKNIKKILYDKKIQFIPNSLSATSIRSKGTSLAWNLLHTGVDSVWSAGYTGNGVLVAVIDTGVNYNHADLADHMWEHADHPNHGYDFINDDNNPMDDNRHGTHCAGTVAGDGTSGIKTGAAPDATIMAIKVLDYMGSGTQSSLLSGLQFAVTYEADIISLSLGMTDGSESARTSLRNAMNNVLAAGVIAVVAAGNSGGYQTYFPVPYNIDSPGDCPSPWEHPDQTLSGGLSACVTVGATDKNDNKASFSSIGATEWDYDPPYNDYPYNPEIGLIKPDVVAPGVFITSLHYTNDTGYQGSFSGTSMATPLVAGIMALMLDADNTLTPAEINQYIEESAKHITDTKSNEYGSGRIKAMNTINAIP